MVVDPADQAGRIGQLEPIVARLLDQDGGLALAAGDEAEAVGAQGGGRRAAGPRSRARRLRSGLDAVPSIRSRVPTRARTFLSAFSSGQPV